ncbi:MAG: hypothetical protein J6A58_06500 [Oscillospiraceae bacterium]|nr:hypothetical protein [Oscillospiraceae bacterium]
MVTFIKEGVLKNIIALSLSIMIIVSCMYNYSKEYILLFAFVTIVLQAFTFSLYNYIAKKSMILRFISVLGAFAAMCILVVIAIKTGQNKNSIDFFIWFLSPQALVEFSLSYIIATFVSMNFFIASTVYYFSAVRYRISWTFMITLIPFAFYRKEGSQVPVFFAMALLVLYVALMIHCRQLNTKPNQKSYIDKGYKKSVVYFLSGACFFSLIIPKPDISIDNSWINYWLESEAFTNYMLSRLGLMSDTSTSIDTYIDFSDIQLYEFISGEENINLKHQTFCDYDFEKNSWSKDITDAEKSISRETEITPDTLQEEAYKAKINPVLFYNTVVKACDTDKSFASKYNLENLNGNIAFSKYKKTLSMIKSNVNYYSTYYFVPSFANNIYGTNKYPNTGKESDIIFIRNDGTFYNQSVHVRKYTLEYYSQELIHEEKFLDMIKNLNFENYDEFLDILYNIVTENDFSDEEIEVVEAYKSDYEAALKYMERYFAEGSDKIDELSQKITEKSEAIIDKASSIQDYFKLNDFVYDLSYNRPDGFDMDYFLFEGKTGICGEYATAMTILSRYAGIPARYCEGIHLGTADVQTGIIEVTDADLHAYPELFIPGYGWVYFEPTQVDIADDGVGYDYVMSVILAVVTVLVIAFIVIFAKFIYPALYEKYFARKIFKVQPEKAIELVSHRITGMTEISETVTIREISDDIRRLYDVDMSLIVELFECVVYGNIKISKEKISDVYSIYKSIKLKRDEIMKNNKRFRKAG